MSFLLKICLFMRKNIANELSWIAPRNERQAEWLTNYMFKQGLPVYREIYSDELYVDYMLSLKKHWQEYDDNAENRELARKAKNAWNNYAKRTDSYQVSIPKKHKKNFDRLAKKYDMPISKLLPILVNDEFDRIKDRAERRKLNQSEITSDYLTEISQLKKQLEDKDEKIVQLERELQQSKQLSSQLNPKPTVNNTLPQEPADIWEEFEQ